MKAICFIQEVKEGDLTIREQMLVCRRALRKLRWPCVLELFAQAGTEEQPLSLRPGMVELLHAAANGEADVLVVVDAAHLYCGRPELEGCWHRFCTMVSIPSGQGWKLDRARRTSLDGPPRI